MIAEPYKKQAPRVWKTIKQKSQKHTKSHETAPPFWLAPLGALSAPQAGKKHFAPSAPIAWFRVSGLGVRVVLLYCSALCAPRPASGKEGLGFRVEGVLGFAIRVSSRFQKHCVSHKFLHAKFKTILFCLGSLRAGGPKLPDPTIGRGACDLHGKLLKGHTEERGGAD